MKDLRKPFLQSIRHPDAPASELLILADGTIFAHNLTPEMAALLGELNPGDAAMRRRAEAARTTPVKADL